MRQIGPEVTPSSDLSTASVLVPSDSEQLQAQTHRIDEEIDERPSTSYQPEVQQLIAPESASYAEPASSDPYSVEGAEADGDSLSSMLTWSSGDQLPAHDATNDPSSSGEDLVDAPTSEMRDYAPPMLERFSAPEENVSVDYPAPQVPMALEASAWEWGPVDSAVWDGDTRMSSVSESIDEFQGDDPSSGVQPEADEESASAGSTSEARDFMSASFASEAVSDSVPPPVSDGGYEAVARNDEPGATLGSDAGVEPRAIHPVEVVSAFIAADGDERNRERIAALLERLASRIRKGEISLGHSANVASETAVLASLLTALLSEAL